MNDKCFFNELWIVCYKAQIDCYPFGHPSRTNFQPIVPTKSNRDGSFDRNATLETYTYSSMFTDDQKTALLAGDQ